MESIPDVLVRDDLAFFEQHRKFIITTRRTLLQNEKKKSWKYWSVTLLV